MTLMAWQFGHVLEMHSVILAAKQAAQAVLAAVLMNVSIVGINQVYDKKLDRVNKPYLPMASGAFSTDTALTVIAVCTTLSFVIGVWSGSSALMWALVISLVLGIVYSVDYPGLRWKRSPVLAASCVLFVRAIIVQLGFFAHALGRGLTDFNFPINLWCAICFMTVYGVVIALFKDLPDVEGDLKQRCANAERATWTNVRVQPVSRTSLDGIRDRGGDGIHALVDPGFTRRRGHSLGRTRHSFGSFSSRQHLVKHVTVRLLHPLHLEGFLSRILLVALLFLRLIKRWKRTK